jgi:hypothetical protein
MKLLKIFACTIVGFFLLLHTAASATADDLYLCGVVTKLDVQKSLITVDVKSESCRGLHSFKLPAVNDGTFIDVDKKICFHIESSTCKSSEIYSITKIDNRNSESGSSGVPAKRPDSGR